VESKSEVGLLNSLKYRGIKVRSRAIKFTEISWNQSQKASMCIVVYWVTWRSA